MVKSADDDRDNRAMWRELCEELDALRAKMRAAAPPAEPQPWRWQDTLPIARRGPDDLE